MDAEQLTWANGASRTRPDDFRTRCRRQEVVIDRLGDAVAALHRGATALKEQNAELRSETSRLRNYRRFPPHAAPPLGEREPGQGSPPPDDPAPRAAPPGVPPGPYQRAGPSAPPP